MTLAGTSTAAAAAAVWWVAASAGGGAPAGEAPGPTPPPVVASVSSVVCVGPDRVLRGAGSDGSCPPGHRALELEPEQDEGLCELCDPFKDPPEPDPGDDRELDALQARIAALENAPYFEVIDKAGGSVFSIGPGGLRFYNKQGRAVAGLATSEAGGVFNALSGATPTQLTFGVSGTTAGLRVVEEGLVRMDLTTRDGRSSLRMPSGNGLIAGLGESVSKTGALLLGTRDGVMRVSFTVPESGAVMTVNGANQGGLSLSEARIGGGLLDLADAAGDSIVRMGHVQNRYGIVMTGPVLGFPLVPKSGLPGSFFLGCGAAAPPACVPAIQ